VQGLSMHRVGMPEGWQPLESGTFQASAEYCLSAAFLWGTKKNAVSSFEMQSPKSMNVPFEDLQVRLNLIKIEMVS